MQRDGLSAFLDALPHPALVLDRDLRVFLANRRATALLASNHAPGVCGQRIEHLLQPADGERDLIGLMDGGDKVSFVACLGRHRTEDTERAFFEVSVDELALDQQSARLALIRELQGPELQTLVRALEVREARLAEATKASRVGIFDVDHRVSGGAAIPYWSPTMREILGYPADRPSDYTWYRERVHPDDVDQVDAAVIQSSDPDGDGLIELEYRWKHPSGRVLWVLIRATTYFGEIDGQRVPVRTIGTLMDVTERRISDQEHRTRSAILDASPDFVAVADADMRLSYLNRAGRRFLGIGPDEDLGERSLFSVHPPASLEKIEREGLPAALGHGAWTAETRFVRHDGQIVPMSQVLLAHRDASGALVHFCTIARDLSKEKSLEEQFRHSQKLEAIGRLAGGIAHDFNNLLSAILGFSELAGSVLDAGAPARRYLEEVRRAAERAASLTSQLLAFGRKQILQARVLDVNQLLEEIRPMLRRLVDAGIEIRVRPCPGPARIKADPVQVEQILLNLVINARDAMPDGGTLTLQARSVTLDDSHVAQRLELRVGSYVVIAVTDTGQGMDAETRERIFEPFFTTKAPGLGTGLGLSTVFGIVRQSGGSICVESELDRGTTFEIYLPRTEEPILPPPARSHPRKTVRGEVVLVTEDDDALRSMIVTALQHAGFRVLSAANPAEALALARDHEGAIDLLLTDVSMPGMNGRELAERLLASHPKMPVVYMSGYTEDSIVHEGVLVTGVRFIAKPFTPGQLVAAIQRVLESS